MDKVRIAVLGCGNIAHRFVRGLKMSDKAVLYGFGATDKARAEEYGRMYEAEVAGTYEDILNDGNVDAVYISTYNPGHYELISDAIRHHKHVMCEKPMVPTARKVNELFDLAEEYGVILMEACKGVFLPMNKDIKRMVAEKVIGDVIYVHASYCGRYIRNRSHWIFDPETGGSLQDLGSYPVSVINFILGSAPKEMSRYDEYLYGVESFSQAIIRYPGNIQGHIQCGYLVSTPNRLEVYGTEGMIFAENFWKGNHAELILNGQKQDLEYEMKSDFYYEVDHFAECILRGMKESDVMSRQASLDIEKIIER